MEADVTDCTMGNTFTMAVTDLLSSLNLEDSDDLDELQDSLDELDDELDTFRRMKEKEVSV